MSRGASAGRPKRRSLVERIAPAVECIVPGVKNKPLAVAKRAILAGRCRVGSIRLSYSARIAKGRVISQQPAAGARLEEGGRVDLVASRGRR